MKDLITNIDWASLFQALWTLVLVPVFSWAAKELHDWARAKKIDKYTDMLCSAVSKVVKEMYQTVIEHIKGTDEWTPQKQAEVREIAKTKILAAITTEGCDILRAANSDFEDWLISLIEAAIYDEKRFNS